MIGQFELLIVIDCKDYSKPIDVKSLEEFMGLSQDVGANKAAMVSAKGYSATAKKRAEDAGVELYRVLDSGAHPWRVDVQIPAVCEFTGIKAVSVRFSGTGFVRLSTNDFREQEVFDVEERPMGKIKDLLKEKWNTGTLPKEAGWHEQLELARNPVKIQTDGAFYTMNIHANLLIETRRYFGKFPVKDISGMYDELKELAIVRNIQIESVEFGEVERSWKRIQAVEELAIKPAFILRAFDVYGQD